MKYIVIFFSLFFVSLFTFSQNFKYSGSMNSQIFSKMTPIEILLYVDCITEIGMEKYPIKWVSEETMNKIKKKKNYYFSIEVSADNITEEKKQKFTFGKNRLDNSEHMITINRKDTLSEIKFTTFY